MHKPRLNVCVLAAVAAAGCNNQHADEIMPSSFSPPGIQSLADIETADASYGNDSIVIQGVVSGQSQGGWPGKNDNYEVHCFTFAAWQRLGGTTVERDLTILRSVPPDFDYWDDFPKYSLQRIRVLLSDDETRAIFEKALPVDDRDDELQAISDEMQKPVIVATKRFGDLVLDRSIDWFESETKWNGETIRITFPADNETIGEDALQTAETLWANQAEWKNRVEAYAVKELLELKNGTWLQDDESEFTAEQFIATMTLTSISIDSDGEFEFWYDDGDLFWGHSIMVRGNLKDGPVDAGIHG